ncbi:MAG: hypothetical protein JRH10_07920 [Deltaproteobacteria bacterium]|nr:hypothetical protein [Deltaproteobacteria bacterium]MBW2444378.1 hypothetical protein [Deltaproteobacteria bacterium]
MALERPIEQYESVATWAHGLREQWGGDPLAEEPEKLAGLTAFCEFDGRNPDELLAFCFLRRKETGVRFASVKRREAMAEQLRAFRTASGLSGTEGRRLTSNLLSFFIHNGIQMHTGML